MTKASDRKLNALSAPEYIKHCCKLLSAYGVRTVTFDYDGYGDSGDFNSGTVHVLPSIAQIDKAGTMSTTPKPELYERAAQLKTQNWESFVNEREKEEETTNKKPVMSKEMCERFFDSAFELLPGGWEINEGSYGTITIDIATEQITVGHNERYTDVRSETFNY